MKKIFLSILILISFAAQSQDKKHYGPYGYYSPIQYGANYGSAFNDRSVVDKRYVDSIVGTVTGGSSTFAGLTDVNLTSVANNDFATYDNASSKWINKTPAQIRTILGLASIATSGSASDLSTGTIPSGRIAGTATDGFVATLVGGVPTWQAGSTPTYGTYAYTCTAVANVNNISVNTNGYYTRIGDLVTVSIEVTCQPTALGANEFAISLPIASNFSNTYELNGVGMTSIGVDPAYIEADATNDRARITFSATVGTIRKFKLQFTYKVI